MPVVAIVIEEPMWRSHPNLVGTIRRAARLALSAEPSGRRQQNAASASLLLSGDVRLKQLNAAFRGRPKPTNVLSFPALNERSPYAGDVALAYGVLHREAISQNKSLAEHAAHLTVHGILHLLGYDHDCPNDAKVMESLEISLLRELGIGNPYCPVPVRRRPKQPRLKKCPKVLAR